MPTPDSSSQVGLPATKREMPLSEVADQPLKLTGANWEAIYEQLKKTLSRYAIIQTDFGKPTAIGYSSFKPLPRARMPACWAWTMSKAF